MKRLVTLALTAALAAPAAVAAQPSPFIMANCVTGTDAARSEAPNLHGNWDFLMDVRGTPNFRLLSIGFVGNKYGGSLALWMTAPVVLREVTLMRATSASRSKRLASCWTCGATITGRAPR